MFKKLLKYDMSSVWRLWWIGAIVTPLAAVVGGITTRMQEYINDPDTERTLVTMLVSMVSGITIFICVLTIFISFVLTMVLVYVRFYKNFFTDEGYLTFTLPVSRRTLLLSKTVNATIWYALHFVLMAVSLAVFSMLLPPAKDGQIFNFTLFETVADLFKMIWASAGAWTILYVSEIILWLAVGTVLSICTIQLSITIGSIIAKKAKIIVSIGIYYLINSAISILGQIGVFSAIYALLGGLATLLPDASINKGALILALFVLIGILATASICVLLYCITQSLLDRKLNLS